MLSNDLLEDLIQDADETTVEICKELQQLRKSEIRPAKKFVKLYGLSRQMVKIEEETQEAYEAFNDYTGAHRISETAKAHFIDALIDVMTAARTTIAKLTNEKGYRKAVVKNTEKNRKRGYYEP